MALTQQELDNLAAMPREELERWLVLIREALTLYGNKGGMGMSESAVKAMTDVVDDKQMQAIVAEQKAGRSEPGWLKPPPPKKPEEQRSGPVNPPPLEGRSDIKWVDQMCDVQDALDRAERVKGFGLAGLGGPRVVTKEDK